MIIECPIIFIFLKQTHYKILETAQPLRNISLKTSKRITSDSKSTFFFFVKSDVNTIQITMTLMEKILAMIEKNIEKRCIKKAQFIKTKLDFINLFFFLKSEYSKALRRPGPESTLCKTPLRVSLVKLVQTGLDKKSHGFKTSWKSETKGH